MCAARSKPPRPASSASLSIERKQRRRNPAPPFTTSTLQQEAARKLGFGAQRTMRLAQQLYEGVDFGEGAVGLITYMRTDSVNLANEAVQEIRQVIARTYGAGFAARSAARLQDQVEERAGSARSDPSDLGGDHARAARRQDRCRPAQAVQPDLEARGRQPDGAGGLRHRRRRSRAGHEREARRRRGRAARQRLDAGEARLHRRI